MDACQWVGVAEYEGVVRDVQCGVPGLLES